MNSLPLSTHPKGELTEAPKTPEIPDLLTQNARVPIETFGGRVHVEWDPQAAVTPFGQLPFFIEFLKLSGLFDTWVAECPLVLTSPNAPTIRDLLGTLMLSVLAGHTRYSHITGIRSDNLNPELLGMSKIVSEDSMRRNLSKIPEAEGIIWMKNALKNCYLPVLARSWIMDIDTRIKTLYGGQEGAVIGYNPHTPGRPSHTYHTYFMANLRLILDVEVQPGNQSAASYSAPNLWALLDEIPRSHWPQFIRGDCAFGTENVMAAAEQKGLDYLFKIKQTANVKRAIEYLKPGSAWKEAGNDWLGQEVELQLPSWSKARRVIVLRRTLSQAEVKSVSNKKSQKVGKKEASSFLTIIKEYQEPIQQSFDFGTGYESEFFGYVGERPKYKYAVLVTSLTVEIGSFGDMAKGRSTDQEEDEERSSTQGASLLLTRSTDGEAPGKFEKKRKMHVENKREGKPEILTIAQLYRDRADCENIFDELSNQWGWCGFTTQDMKRCQLTARVIALVYNWWNLFVRLADPDKHLEAVTSRPLLLNSVARKTTHSGQTCIAVSTSHGHAEKVRSLLNRIVVFFQELKNSAEQLTANERWYRMLSKAVEKYLQGKQLEVLILQPAPS